MLPEDGALGDGPPAGLVEAEVGGVGRERVHEVGVGRLGGAIPAYTENGMKAARTKQRSSTAVIARRSKSVIRRR